MTTQTVDFQTVIQKAMKNSLISLFDCYWYGEGEGYDEEFLSEIEKYRKKNSEWAKLLYTAHLKEEGGINMECGSVFEFVEDVAKAALRLVDWKDITQHTEKLLKRQK
jgi:hypothetical protein